MRKSWCSWAAFLCAAFYGSSLEAQGAVGPTLAPAGTSGTSATGNYTAPPVVTLPAEPNAAFTPAATVPTVPSYNPVPVTRTPSLASTPAVAPQAAQSLPPPTPLGTPTTTPYSGGASYTSQGPTSYTLPTYQPSVAAQPMPNSSYGASGAYPSGSPYGLQPGSVFAGQEMPAGNLSAKELAPFAKPQSPPSYTAWLPTKVASLMPHSWMGTAPSAPPAVAGNGCNPPGYECGPCATYGNWYDNFNLLSSYDAFKGPLDLDGLNGNFGKRVGGMAAFPILRDWGFGGQIGSTAGWYDWKGTQYTGDQERFQNFITAGIFQRSYTTGLGWGIVHDWLNDNYYSDFHFSQFRAAGSWQFNCNNEVGVWAALPQRRDEAFIGTPAVQNRFQTVLQGNLYWRRMWSDFASSTVFVGLAESPSDIPWGGNVQVAVNRYVALIGAAEYILPGSGGLQGRQEEIWSLSLGLAFYPGTAMQAARSPFRPFLPMADNGNFAVWRR